jgi:hypothetical protein
MADELHLRPAREDDLAIIEALTQDPELTGEFAWFGWHYRCCAPTRRPDRPRAPDRGAPSQPRSVDISVADRSVADIE